MSANDGVVVERGRVGEPIGRSVGFDWTPSAAVLPAGEEIEFVVSPPYAATRQLAGQLTPALDPGGRFLYIGLAGTSPERAATIVNAVAARFVAVAAELKRAKLEEETGILQEQLQGAERNLRTAERALEEYRVGTITLPSERATIAPPGLDQTTDPAFRSFFEMQIERDQIRRDQQAIQRALRGGSVVQGLEVIPTVQRSSELSQALAELANKRAELRTLQTRYTDEYVPVRRVKEEIEALEGQTIPRLASGLLSELSTRTGALDARIADVRTELQEIPTRSIEEQSLQRQLASADNLYTNLLNRFEQSRLAAASSIPDVRVLDPAVVPGQPTNDEQQLQLILMFLAGSLGLGVLGAILLDRADPRLRYPEQVTQEMGLSILGAVPHVAAPSKRLGTQNTAQVIEAFREIRLNLAHAYGAAGPLLVTITSPGMGDGKSFISSNLALAFADQGYRTLLLDGDIRRGGLHRLFETTRVPGLTDYLAGNASREQIIHESSFPGLHLIACGTRMKGGPELLGSQAMSKLVLDLRSEYDVILIDSPPLGAGVDPFALGTLAGNLLLVLRTGNTNRELAGAKLELLDRLPIRLLGAVLNDVPARGIYRYYSYIPGYESEDETLAAGSSAPKQLQGV